MNATEEKRDWLTAHIEWCERTVKEYEAEEAKVQKRRASLERQLNEVNGRIAYFKGKQDEYKRFKYEAEQKKRNKSINK